MTIQDKIKLAIDRGSIKGARKLASIHLKEETKELIKVPCPTCDTDVDDGTCPACNGEGQIDSNEYKYLTELELEPIIDSYLNNLPEYKSHQKDKKEKQKESILVTHNTVPYQGDSQSINYMSSVVAIANAKFNKALAEGVSYIDAYNQIYKMTIPWKNSANEISEVQVESVVEALELAMTEVKNIIGAKL